MSRIESRHGRAEVLLKTHDPTGALAGFQEALKLRLALAEADPKNAQVRSVLAMTQGAVGDAMSQLGDLDGALGQHQNAAAGLDARAAADPENLVLKSETALMRSKVGADYASLASSGKSPIKQRVLDWRAARSWFQRSSDLWAEVKARGHLMKRDEEEPERVAREIARCDAALANLTRQAEILPQR